MVSMVWLMVSSASRLCPQSAAVKLRRYVWSVAMMLRRGSWARGGGENELALKGRSPLGTGWWLQSQASGGWGQPFEGLGLSTGVSPPQGSYQGPRKWGGGLETVCVYPNISREEDSSESGTQMAEAQRPFILCVENVKGGGVLLGGQV